VLLWGPKAGGKLGGGAEGKSVYEANHSVLRS
jgi:hypothetical protein